MQKRPSSAHVVLRYEHIDKGKFTPTYDDVGDINGSIEARAAAMADRVNQRDDQRDPHLLVRLVIEIPVESIAEARRLAEADWAPVNLEPPEPTLAHIPGKMYANYQDGVITGIWFAPAAGHPGYQDASFFVESGPDAEEGDDRPFWDAVAHFLDLTDRDPTIKIGWEG